MAVPWGKVAQYALPVIGGLFGMGKKKRPPPPLPYLSNPMFNFKRGQFKGQGALNTLGTDHEYYRHVMRNARRRPGFSDEDIRNMEMLPMEQTKAGESAALRRLNQQTSGSGSFNSGAANSARGRIMMQGTSDRANIRRRVRTAAAEAKLNDLYKQMMALGAYTDPRMQLMHDEVRNSNQFRLAQRGQNIQMRGQNINRGINNRNFYTNLLMKAIEAYSNTDGDADGDDDSGSGENDGDS